MKICRFKGLSDRQYEIDNKKYFAPVEEIEEAIRNNEEINGISLKELKNLVNMNKELKLDVERYSNY